MIYGEGDSYAELEATKLRVATDELEDGTDDFVFAASTIIFEAEDLLEAAVRARTNPDSQIITPPNASTD